MITFIPYYTNKSIVSQDSSSWSEIERRKVLKSIGTLGVTGGFVGMSRLSQGVAATSSHTDRSIKQLNEDKLAQLNSKTKNKDSYQKYQSDFKQESVVEHFKIGQATNDAYRVSTNKSSEDDFYVLSYPVELQIDTPLVSVDSKKNEVSGNLIITFSETNSNANLILEKDTGEQKLARYTVQYPEPSGVIWIRKSIVTAESRNNSQISTQRSENFYPSTKEFKIEDSKVSSVNSNNDILITPQSDKCTCAQIVNALCSVGCGVSVGVPCAIISGPATGVACPVVVGAICATYQIADNCPPLESEEEACQRIGYC